ncbi:MAG: helix-turn-helix domain-containing protein [Candidatus Acidiferrales bacterium]
MEPSANPPVTRDRERQLASDPQACAYVIVIPTGDLPIVEALQKLITTLSSQEPIVLLRDSRKSSLEIVDSWLEHSAAAEYLGVGRSTLYRYSEHHEIESRKFCGRLQYRLSSLDEFKNQHVRPARRSHRGGGIIASALSSGK